MMASANHEPESGQAQRPAPQASDAKRRGILRSVAAVTLAWVLLAMPTSMVDPSPAELHRIAWEYQNATNGRARDFERARKLYQEAAAAGYAWSYYGLATIYSRGQGVPVDFEAARNFYLQAAAGAVDRAVFNLGVIYHKGLGVTRDDRRALGYFKRAAAMGLDHACFSLGVFYEKGYGVPPSPALAYAWYSKAAQSGLPQARAKLAKLKLDRCERTLVIGQ